MSKKLSFLKKDKKKKVTIHDHKSFLKHSSIDSQKPPKKDMSFLKSKPEPIKDDKIEYHISNDVYSENVNVTYDIENPYLPVPTIPLNMTQQQLDLRDDLHQLYMSEKLPFPATQNSDTGAVLKPDVDSNTTDIAALTVRVTTNELNIIALDGRVTTNEIDIASNDLDIAALDGRVTTNELDIATIQAATMDFPICFAIYIEQNQRGVDENIHGSFDSNVIGDTLASGDSIVYTKGRGKIYFVINAGVDTLGTLTVTGTSVDRNTGIETGSDTEDIVIDGVSTDNSSTDGNGNVTHVFVDGYLSSKWWDGVLTISTADLDISDIDIYHVSFEQVNDLSNITLRTFDINVKPTNTSAFLNAHLYLIEKTTGHKADISLVRNLELLATNVTADESYRLRYGGIDQVFDGTGDGIWIELHFGPPAQTYISDFSMKLWFDIQKSLFP